VPTVIEPEIKTELTTTDRPRIGFVSLGCPKNLVDSEVMMGMVHHAGAELTPDAEDADIIVVNTCSFIDSAKQESVNTILEMAAHKTGGRARKLIVTGCLVERYRDEIQKNIPEVDAVLGTGELDGILRAAGLTPKPVPQSGPFNILSESTSQQASKSATPVNGDPSVAQLEHGLAAVNAPAHDHVHLELGGAAALEVEAAQGNLSAATLAESSLIDRASSAVRKHSQMDVPEQTSRPEGDLREKQGRFNRDAWDGATAALPSYLYSDDTPRILTTPRASA
jgi:ribosomal protein S12 methylthiotransferase